ncbi:uncharacterized protein LOC143305421 isoform X1 [Osmia lignaria lignaria]|uniref:uncharacterized protein LOC143305421 isoform X1 n=1 Tax=Osmia lignaria lignaria TaxID=1437193 RepID=UPI00402BCB68
MRALNPRSLQLPTIFRLFPPSFLCLFLLLLVVRAGEARSVHHDEEDQGQTGTKVSSIVSKGGAQLTPEKTEAISVSEQVRGKVVASGSHGIEGGQNSGSEVGHGLDVRDLEKGEAKEIDEVRAEGSQVLNEDEEASVAKKRRRNDVALTGKPEFRESEGNPVDEIRDEGIRRFDVRVDADGVASSPSKEESKPSESRVRIQEVKESKDEIPSSFRKSVKLNEENIVKNKKEIGSSGRSNIEENEESLENRGYRSLSESQGKSRHKSSTVYLSAEEKKISDGQQQSIVEGQIKKLISIRDDVLDAQKTEKTESSKIAGSKREIGMDEVAFMEQEVEGEHGGKVKNIKSIIDDKLPVGGISILEKWKDQAATLQSQIRDRNFLANLKKQAIEVLPEVPKFTEDQLLNVLERIVSSKRLPPLNESYAISVKGVALTENQLRIIKCAEQLVAVRERQSFVSNLVECIQGLNVLNCMRIFVWPIVLDNLPESVSQNLPNFPIEINVFDLFQGNGQKSGRAQDLHRVRLITPDAVVYNILQDALESYPSDQTLISYIDPKNETLKKLLTSNQLSILQMAEKFLPEALRREYSDRMFSCVRRFEYFSCVKYFAWPLIKQYFPALPAFPDYQSWYPIIDLTPQYPILPFPGFSEDVGELPEVVDADATRTRRPRPEAIIIQVLQNTLKEQPRISSSPSFLDQSTDYVPLLPQDQLLTINMAEQLIPISYRPEFVQKTVRCMKEYNYLTCIKYSAWPTVRQFIPTLPDISSLLPDFHVPALSDIGSYVPEIPTYPDLSFYWPISGASVENPTNAPTYYTLKNREGAPQSSDELEILILDILLNLRISIDKSSESSPIILTGNTITFTTFTKRQIDILRLAECLVPPSARATLITDVLTYLQKNNNFIDCARYVIWPTIGRYLQNLPEFPSLENARNPISSTNAQNLLEIRETVTNTGDLVQERVIPETEEKKIAIPFQDKESRNRVTNVPVISVSGTRFVPIFTEQPETVISNILRSVQIQSFKTNARPPSTIKNQQFLDLLNDQQGNIVSIVDTLLPENVRPDFANKMIECLRENNFLLCTRDIIWPTLTQYFPWLPSFPNFGIGSIVIDNSTISTPVQNITEPGVSSDTRLSETDVKTGQHGDTTVTITDTRFFPIYNELPETIILNILKAVQLSLPNLPGSPVAARIGELSRYLTEQQINIVQIAENLLPVPSRADFIENIVPCFRDRNFLTCTRDIVWPTLAQSYPWMPSFPNFGSLPQLPATGSGSIRFQVFLAENPSASLEAQTSRNNVNQKATELAFEDVEQKIENILLDALKKSNAQFEKSYLNNSDPAASHLNERQINIINLARRIIPASNRTPYVARMLDCTKRYNYLACTNNVTWPILKQFIPSLPDLVSLSELLIQFPSIVQIPEYIGIPAADSLANYFLGTSQPSAIPQIPTGISQLPTVIPQLPANPGSGGSNQNSSASLIPSRSGTEEIQATKTSSITPSVGNEGVIPEYAGQPSGILLDISNEKVNLPGNASQLGTTDSTKVKSRKRRSSSEIFNTYYETENASDSSTSTPNTFPNITESEYLQLLIRIRENAKQTGTGFQKSKQYLVDGLNSTIRDSLTADQYEILKIVEDLDDRGSGKGIGSQVIQCILSLSFIRCVGIFVWPLIVSNLPSLLPSLPSFGIFGRSMETENQVQQFFDMSTEDFEKELLKRKNSIEQLLLDWYRKLAEDEYQVNVGFLKIKGYGNNEVGISVTGFREGRGAKIKDNKNLPSILTIISDIMEEVLDQRPEGEKPKKEKDKKERSIDDLEHRDIDIQFLKDSEEYLDIKRSMNDDEIIAMFLNKIKSSDPGVDDDNVKYFDLEDAYNAFGVLFGTKLHEKLARNADSQLGSLDENVESRKEVDIVSLESQKGFDELKVLPLSQITYDFEKESPGDQEEKQRQKRAKNLFKSFLEKHSDNYLRDSDAEKVEDVDENKIIVEEPEEKSRRSGLIIRLPQLDDQIISKKMTNSMTELARGMKMKMGQMLPGFGMVLSFLIQIGLAHARAAASMAGMISNMALGSAIVGMIRDSFFGGNSHPQIKYVYDNHKTGPGITWPSQYGHRHGY